MSMIKALRTLAAIENGTLNAAQLEAQVAGSQARKDEISQLLSVASHTPWSTTKAKSRSTACKSESTRAG